MFTLLTTWKRGRALLMARLAEDSMPLAIFIESIEASPPARVPGTAVFLTSTVDRVPHALLHNLKHNKVLHERVVFLTIHTQDFPRVPAARADPRSPSSAARSGGWTRTTGLPRIPTCRSCSSRSARTSSRST